MTPLHCPQSHGNWRHIRHGKLNIGRKLYCFHAISKKWNSVKCSYLVRFLYVFCTSGTSASVVMCSNQRPVALKSADFLLQMTGVCSSWSQFAFQAVRPEWTCVFSHRRDVYLSPVLKPYICPRQAYLPGTEATVISQAVPPGRGPSIALRLGWRLR